MRKFDKLYKEMVSDVFGGAVGGQDEAPTLGNNDFYASGDARMPKVIGAKTVKDKKKGRKKQKIPMFRRTLSSGGL